jgi:4-hydroxybenzoate polyprenyltransferase
MASYRGSALWLLQSSRMLAAGANKRSGAFCGNNIYRAPAPMKIRPDRQGMAMAMATHRRISASSAEPPPPRQHAPASWVDRWLPTAAKPYAMLARLDKPDAIWLYAWPCIWYYVSTFAYTYWNSPTGVALPYYL